MYFNNIHMTNANVTDVNKLTNIFTNIYENNIWGMGQCESKSGMGSSDDFTLHIRKILLNIITTYDVKNMIDVSCGDWAWMKKIKDELTCDYLGIDIVDKVIAENIREYSS